MKQVYEKSCSQCGGCCQKEVCSIGVRIYGVATPPCEGLIYRDGKYWCQLFELCAGVYGEFLMFRLGIGMGCDGVLESTREQ